MERRGDRIQQGTQRQPGDVTAVFVQPFDLPELSLGFVFLMCPQPSPRSGRWKRLSRRRRSSRRDPRRSIPDGHARHDGCGRDRTGRGHHFREGAESILTPRSPAAPMVQRLRRRAAAVSRRRCDAGLERRPNGRALLVCWPSARAAIEKRAFEGARAAPKETRRIAHRHTSPVVNAEPYDAGSPARRRAAAGRLDGRRGGQVVTVARRPSQS